MSPLREIVDSLQGQVAKIEDDLKVNLEFHFCSMIFVDNRTKWSLFYCQLSAL